jgi:hypothetical protein
MSIPGDMTVIHMLENELKAVNPRRRARLLNETLYDFGLSLLVAR